MPTQNLTLAEQRAESATKLPAFNRMNLLSVRSSVAELLSHIGAQSIFAEYTKHDISHIDALLTSLEWLVPPESAAKLTSADWLMLVLSVYFHDMGLVVTRDEFEARDESEFPAYKDGIAIGEKGEEYKAKVDAMPELDAEKFLYQEFVRENHAHRIRAWIGGGQYANLGKADSAATIIREILQPLDTRFRRDLALICESHHLNDLLDFAKYKVSQPYGNQNDEICNLHYVAIILRTADLVHVTSDRTPSIAFRLINPSDPKSVVEWKKQMPMVSVRPVAARNIDGDITPDKQSDTIGFHALFEEPEGYFALTSYLNFVKSQLRLASEWADVANRKQGSPLRFPWRKIDESGIEAEGFLKKEFEFTVDQTKILDLLTGHTLYNDASVVIRELVQNGIDAVRLDAFEAEQAIAGGVQISWDSKSSVLTVEDTGTGMSQEIIERHFLRAGSSRYQDPEFQKTHTGFSSISRFGIGVLSAFMISDEVEVFTVSRNQDEKARKLTLRSLHGKYLIKEYERSSSVIPERIRQHGTSIRLRMRAGSQNINVAEAARHWILFPPCEVTVAIDAQEPERVGFDSVRGAVDDTLKRINASAMDYFGPVKYEIREFRANGVDLAVAFRWSEFFQEWTFLTFDPFLRPSRHIDDEPTYAVGTCVEGIRIDDVTPGYTGQHIIAVANATGVGSPKTNVARSGFEATAERTAMLSKVSGMYCQHVQSEVSSMHEKLNFSPTWAATEAGFLVQPLLDASERSRPIDVSLLEKKLAEIPSILLERDANREIVSVEELNKIPSFWTIDSTGIRSLESLFKEVPQPLSLSSFSNVVTASTLNLPDEPVLGGLKESGVIMDLAFRPREIDTVRASEKERRLDLRWISTRDLWKSAYTDNDKIRQFIRPRLADRRYSRSTVRHIYLALSEQINVAGLEGYIGFRHAENLYLLKDRPITGAILQIVQAVERGEKTPDELLLVLLATQEAIGRVTHISDRVAFINRVKANHQTFSNSPSERMPESLDDGLLDAITGGNLRIFDARAWRRSSAYEEDWDF